MDLKRSHLNKFLYQRDITKRWQVNGILRGKNNYSPRIYWHLSGWQRKWQQNQRNIYGTETVANFHSLEGKIVA